MNYSQLLEDVKQEVTGFFESHHQSHFTYHNITHTESVVARAGEIARFYQLADREYFIVVTAAWFHDSGYYAGEASGHEKKGAELAGIFLRAKGVDEETIGKVRDCIMATCMPQSPHDLLEKIVADADLYHWGTGEFPGFNKRMRKEASWRLGHKIDKTRWRADTIRLLESHQYQTDYARDLLEPVKQQNIALLRAKDSDAGREDDDEPIRSSFPVLPKSVPAQVTVGKSKPEKEKREGKSSEKNVKTDRPERGIETMFRISSANHQRLSDMADNKANIMITTTSIILSVLLSVLLRKLEDNPHLIIPTLILLLVCVVTMVFSILATRPSLPGGTFTRENIEDKKVNLLFFGNFYRMAYEQYESGMQSMMNDRDFLYGSLTRDVYSQGVVLGRKYRLLRIAYNVFMFGVIVSVLAFIVAVTINGI
ncbi:MAG: phosphohydrolase [Chitinophagaceae bacterium]|nr:MAG: phosphohydrolase [Chitinophagaceae bacterium]